MITSIIEMRQVELGNLGQVKKLVGDRKYDVNIINIIFSK